MGAVQAREKAKVEAESPRSNHFPAEVLNNAGSAL